MKPALENFLEEIKKVEDVIGVALFGSHAKGTNRENSDIDLLILSKTSTRREIAHQFGADFEIVYATLENTASHYKNNLDDYVRFWEHAQILLIRKSSWKLFVMGRKNLRRMGKSDGGR